MKKRDYFFTNLWMNALRYVVLLILAALLMLAGAFWRPLLFYIGLAVLGVYLLICLMSALHMLSLINYRSDDDPEFNRMMDELTADPTAFLEGMMQSQQENRELHGEELLSLNDDDLFETVDMQNLDIADAADDPDRELDEFSGARRTVFVLSLYDAEVQNGGLCQFFVNSSRQVAPFVAECLEQVGAAEHKQLFLDFVTQNDIDLTNLGSFDTSTRRGYVKQTKRYDFDGFDNQYYDLPPLQAMVTDYIRRHIEEF